MTHPDLLPRYHITAACFLSQPTSKTTSGDRLNGLDFQKVLPRKWKDMRWILRGLTAMRHNIVTGYTRTVITYLRAGDGRDITEPLATDGLLLNGSWPPGGQGAGILLGGDSNPRLILNHYLPWDWDGTIDLQIGNASNRDDTTPRVMIEVMPTPASFDAKLLDC